MRKYGIDFAQIFLMFFDGGEVVVIVQPFSRFDFSGRDNRLSRPLTM